MARSEAGWISRSGRCPSCLRVESVSQRRASGRARRERSKVNPHTRSLGLHASISTVDEESACSYRTIVRRTCNSHN